MTTPTPATIDPEPKGDSPGGEGKLRWILGWIVVPGSLIALLFLAGVHVGARHPDMWMSRLMLWMYGGEADLAAPASGGDGGARPFSMEVTLPVTETSWMPHEASCKQICRETYEARKPGAEVVSISECELTPTRIEPGEIACRGRAKLPAGVDPSAEDPAHEDESRDSKGANEDEPSEPRGER